MVVLSLFDGISCGQIAFERLGITFDGIKNKYIASEIKPIAIETTMLHYPNTIQVGDVCKLHYDSCTNALYANCDCHDNKYYINNATKVLDSKPDIIIGGSPCQNFSTLRVTSGNGKVIDGLEGDKSVLFYEYLRLLKEIQPTYFLLENVRMHKDSKKELDDYLGVNGMLIDSKLVSFQTRARYYWTNIPNVVPPQDKNISYQNYIDTNTARCNEATPNRTPSRIKMWHNGESKINTIRWCANLSNATKVGCLTRKQDRCPNSGMMPYNGWARFLTRREQEQAQTLPIGYCDHLSYNKTCDVIGDGWTVDVIKHILSFIPKGAI
jgi:DNA (cytosine-5)-methyltransferase 3A